MGLFNQNIIKNIWKPAGKRYPQCSPYPVGRLQRQYSNMSLRMFEKILINLIPFYYYNYTQFFLMFYRQISDEMRYLYNNNITLTLNVDNICFSSTRWRELIHKNSFNLCYKYIFHMFEFDLCNENVYRKWFCCCCVVILFFDLFLFI